MACETFVSYYFYDARYYKNYDEILSFRLNDTNNKYEADYDEILHNTSDEYDEKYDEIYDEVVSLYEYNWYNGCLCYC